jgi:membrane protease YdiL (CAAX protease family)
VSRERISLWWLAAPTLLIALNLAAILTSSQQSTKNGVYHGAIVAGALASAMVLGGYALLAGRFGSGDAGAALALHRPSVPAWRAAGMAALVVAVVVVVSLALEPFLHGDRRQGLTPTRAPHGQEWAILAVAVLVLGVVVPLGEELLFRGLYFNCLGRFAVPGSAAAFAIAHGLPALLIQVAVAGLALGELRRRTDSLWSGVGAHATVNLLGIAAALATT